MTSWRQVIQDLLAAIALAVVLLGVLFTAAGCRCVVPAAIQTHEPCYALVMYIPDARVAVLFNRCNGRVEYQNLPPLPDPRAGS